MSTSCASNSSTRFPTISLGQELAPLPEGRSSSGARKNPKNQGAWSFIEPEIESILTKVRGKPTRMSYAGPQGPASPATGLASRHKVNSKRSSPRPLA